MEGLVTLSTVYQDYLAHHGIKGQKWGTRRFQYEDGSLTEEGRRRYAAKKSLGEIFKKAELDHLDEAKLADREAKKHYSNKETKDYERSATRSRNEAKLFAERYAKLKSMDFDDLSDSDLESVERYIRGYWGEKDAKVIEKLFDNPKSK